MKTKQERYYLPAAACLVAALCLLCTAACTDTAGNDPGMDTDAGRTPVILSAGVHGMPATRSNTAAGVWTDGDMVGLEVGGFVKQYIVHATAGATATLRPADEANTHYWPGTTTIVRAWFYGNKLYSGNMLTHNWFVSASQNGTGPDGESSYQRSDFLYAPARTLTYDPQQQGGGAALTFYHQTARVVVRIRKAGVVDDANKGNLDVDLGAGPLGSSEMWQHATFSASAIDPAAGQYSGLKADETTTPAYIVTKPVPDADVPDGYACCYEALVIPQDMSGKHFIRVTIYNANGAGTYYYIPAAGKADLHGGYTYTYDITVSQHGTLHVTAATPIAGWTDNGEGGSGTAYELIDPANPPASISGDGVYLLTGEANDMTLNITGGNPTVIVRDLKLTNSCIHITGGTPEIRVEGTNNYLYGIDNPPIWLDGNDANVRITGRGVTVSGLRLNVNAGEPYAAIGTRGDAFSKEAYWCGNIAISGLTLDADVIVGGLNGFGGAVIGTGGGKGNRRCGNITVTDARIIATPGAGAAAIGFGTAIGDADMTGTTYEMGNITLTNSTIESRIVQGSNGFYPAHIGGGAVPAEHYTVGTIAISTDKSGTDFFAQFNGGTKALDEVIIGFPGGTRDWLIRWKTDTKFYFKIPWDLVPGLR